MIVRYVHGKQSIKSGLKNDKGDSISLVILFAILLVYVFIPIFAAIIQIQLFYLEASDLREALELSSIATYDSLVAQNASRTSINYDNDKLDHIFKYYLSRNLHINPDLTPKPGGCIPEGTVTVDSINVYLSGFPTECPDGVTLTRPAVHARITVPIKPVLFRYTILELLGLSTIDCKFHTDTEIPENR